MKIKKIIKTTLIISFLFIFFNPFNSQAAGTKKIGEQCQSNSDCNSNDCEKSTLTDVKGNNKWFCDCWKDKNCTDEYGTSPSGLPWTCEDGTNESYDLDYCLDPGSETVKYSVKPGTDGSIAAGLVDAVTDPGASAQNSMQVILAKGIQPPKLEINVPGLNFSSADSLKKAALQESDGTYMYIPFLGEYFLAIYKYVVVISSVAAVILMMFHGFRWIISGGNPGQIEEAKKGIEHAIIGLMLAAFSYAFLFLINPNLVSFRSIKVQYVVGQELQPGNELVSNGEIFNSGGGTFSGPSNFGANNVPDLKQCDTKWKDTAYKQECFTGTKAKEGNYLAGSICAGGCGITSLADVLNYYGHKVSPIDTAAFSVKVEARTNECLGTKGPTMCKNVESEWPDLKCQQLQPNNLNAIVNNLRNKKPLIFSCHSCHGLTKDNTDITFSEHYMVLTGVDESGSFFSVNDPGRNNGMIKISSNEFQGQHIVYVFLIEKKDDSTIKPTISNSKPDPQAQCTGASATDEQSCLDSGGTWQ